MKILKSWTDEERWSAYDTDTFYYVKVEHEGKTHTLRSSSPWEISQIEKDVNVLIQRSKAQEESHEMSNYNLLEEYTKVVKSGDNKVREQELYSVILDRMID